MLGYTPDVPESGAPGDETGHPTQRRTAPAIEGGD
jgi:hypothetical protein